MIENKPQDYENGVTTHQSAAQKMKFFIKDFIRKWYQIRSFPTVFNKPVTI